MRESESGKTLEKKKIRRKYWCVLVICNECIKDRFYIIKGKE